MLRSTAEVASEECILPLAVDIGATLVQVAGVYFGLATAHQHTTGLDTQFRRVRTAISCAVQAAVGCGVQEVQN